MEGEAPLSYFQVFKISVKEEKAGLILVHVLRGKLRRAHHLTLGAVHRNSAIAWHVRESCRQNVLPLAVHSWASAKGADLEFVQLGRKQGKKGV